MGKNKASKRNGTKQKQPSSNSVPRKGGGSRKGSNTWTKEETNQLKKLATTHQMAWTQVARHLPEKSKADCRNRFFQLSKSEQSKVRREIKGSGKKEKEAFKKKKREARAHSKAEQMEIVNSFGAREHELRMAWQSATTRDEKYGVEEKLRNLELEELVALRAVQHF
ncbi:hypothetical protein T439DRAFT_327328 [Meredithblackwellia eburnea MCA 4105]